MTHNVRKGGIPVFVYATSDAASPVLLSLVFKCNESPAQATLSVQSSLPVDGVDEPQTITLQYDADNLASCSLGPATIPLPQLRLKQISRKGNPQIRTLSLVLKQACPVWHLPTSRPLAARHGFESLFEQLSGLAKARTLYILFDYNWLHRETHAVFEHLVKHPQRLSAFTVDRNFARKYRCADWSIFSTPGDEDSYIATDEEDPLPSYAEASTKRVRHISTSPVPLSPPPKRVLLSPFPEHAPASPTEKGSIATPSPKPSKVLNISSPEFKEALNKAYATLSPTETAGPAASAFPTATSAAHFDRAVEKAVSTILPTMMGTLLPTVLPHLLAVTSPPAPSSPVSATSNPPSPTKLSSLGNLLGAHVARQVETQLQSIYNHTLSHAAWLRNTADDEFREMLEERKVDLNLAKDDALDEINDAVTEKREEFLEQVEEVAEDCLSTFANSADRVCDDAKQRLDVFASEEQVRMQRERGWLGWEREVLERDKRRFEEVKNALERSTTGERGRRAGSAPV